LQRLPILQPRHAFHRPCVEVPDDGALPDVLDQNVVIDAAFTRLVHLFNLRIAP
jgi:hypothetical protein